MGNEISKISLGVMGIFLIIAIWEMLPNMKSYQLISLVITGILYNVGYWTLNSKKNQNEKH